MKKHGSVRDLVEARAASNGDAVYLLDVDRDKKLDYAQLLSEVRAVAAFVASRGIAPGESVAYAMHNGRCCAVTILGLLYGGYRAVAVNLVAGRDVIGYVLSHSRTRLVMTQTEHEPLLREALQCEAFHEEAASDATAGQPDIFIASDDWLDGFSATSPAPAVSENARVGGESGESGESGDAGQRSVNGANCLASASRQTDEGTVSMPEAGTDQASDGLLMYTSGTTGRPKGVVLSHGNLIAGGDNVCLGHQLSSHDRALCVLPLYHINGLCVTLFGPLVSGGSVVMPQRFSTSGFWEWVDRYRCTWFSVVPTQIAYLLRDAGASVERPFLRFGRSASAPLSPDVHESFEKRFGVPLIETMGLTETAAQISSNPMPPAKRKLGSPGIAVGDELRIVNAELQDLPSGEEGELLIRGSNVMQRYFRNTEATHEALLPGGWFRTGDLGKLDDEGFLFITGRLKELIIKGGENIAPREIDDALYRHTDVVEAAAFARACNNFGQRVEAAVSLKPSSSLDEKQLLALCRDSVGKFKCPDRIHFLDELPKGPSGKIQRKKLAELFEQP